MMMRKLTRYMMALGLMAVAVAAHAIVPDMKFRRLDTRDGLSNTQVSCILRDSRGLVWIGTPYGLNRYDGYRVRVYYSQTNDTTTILKSYIDDIQEDADGRLWLRHGPEYSVFDPATERCDRHPERWLHERGLKGGVERLYIDRHKNFWVKTYDQGLWHLNISNGRQRVFTFGHGVQQLRPDLGVSDFAEYGRSLLMASSNGDLVCFHTGDVRISWKSSRLRRMGAPRNAGYSLCIDGERNLWVMVNGRAWCYMRQAGRWFDTAAAALRWRGVSGLSAETKIWDMAVDKHGQLWMSTDHEGLCVADLQGRQLRQFMPVKNDETTISDNTLRQLYRDQRGRMWVATYRNGVNYYAENLFNFRHLDLGNVNTVCVDDDGRYWVGTNDNGIIRYNPATGEQTVFDKQASGLGSDVIVSSLAARDGTLWFGSYEGGLVSWRDGRFTAYRAGQGDGLVHNSIWALAEDRQGNVWIGTLGGGVQRLDCQTGRFITLNTDNSPLPSNYISSLHTDSGGRLLVGHSDFYSLIDAKTLKLENRSISAPQADIPVSEATTIVVQDSRGLIWQGASAGVTVCDVKGNACAFLDMKSGLIGSTVNGIVEDSRHTVWVVTEHGLSNVIPQQQEDGRWTFIVRSYNNRDGLQDGPFNQRSATVTAAGQLLVGGHEGLDIINLRTMATATRSEERPLFSGVKVMDRPVERVGRELHLRSSENQFTVQLASDNGEVHNRARFAYKLDNFNRQWLYSEESHPDITYMGLRPGSYTLFVRMLNGDGTMGDEEIRLPIVIDAPWYRTWWMWLVYMLIALLAVRWLYRRYKEQLRLQQLKVEQESSYRLNEQKQRFYDSVNDELRQPFQNIFESLNGLMQRENDEQRYEEEQQVFGHLENLLEQVNRLSESGQAQGKLQPQIREMEITSLDEKLVDDATHYVENNLDNSDISVETMAQVLSMSRVHLYKRLTAVTGLTPSEFIRQIRLRHAEQLLRKSQLTVAEVAYKVGFNNPRYFSKYFKEMYGMMPSEYKNRRE